VKHPDEVYETFYQAVRRYFGVKFGCLDNLQLLCDHEVQEPPSTFSQIKELEAMAMG